MRQQLDAGNGHDLTILRDGLSSNSTEASFLLLPWSDQYLWWPEFKSHCYLICTLLNCVSFVHNFSAGIRASQWPSGNTPVIHLLHDRHGFNACGFSFCSNGCVGSVTHCLKWLPPARTSCIWVDGSMPAEHTSCQK